MSVAVGDKLRVTARFKHPVSGDVVNVWHLQASVPWVGTPTTAAIMAAVQEWLNVMYSAITNELATALEPYDFRVDKVDLIAGEETVTEVIGVATFYLDTPPGGTGDSLPPQDAAIINFRTLIPRVFGRKYLGPIVESRAADGFLLSTALTNLGTMIANCLAGAAVPSVGTLVAGVLTSKAAGDYFAEFTEGLVNSIFGTQRRRRINRGS